MLRLLAGAGVFRSCSRRSSSCCHIAAFLVELFPARIRYSSLSLPYHIGNGWFGGGVPAIGTALAQATGVALAALWYPMAIAAIGVVVSLAFIREPTHRIRIWDEAGGGAPPLVPTSLKSKGEPGPSIGWLYPDQCEHPLGNRLIKDIIVERVQKFFAIRPALEEIQDFLLDRTGELRIGNVATERHS
jgi:hypothetical protein